jgi:DNA-binding MarR family transcriptional regulator
LKPINLNLKMILDREWLRVGRTVFPELTTRHRVQEMASIPLDAETKVTERPGDHESELRLWLRLLTCTTLIEGEVRRRLRQEFDVTLPRFDLMAQLDKAPGGMTLGELSRRMMVSNGNVTGLSERLMALGLLDRRQSRSDRRAQLVSLTPEGRRVFRTMARAHEGWIAEIFSNLTSADIDALMRLLAKTKASARRAISGGPAR